MSRVALVSRHIVYAKACKPIYGIICIEGEVIKEVVVVCSKVPISALIGKYIDWNPIDLENYYISPGLIDINIRQEWETSKHLTQCALSGGVTLLVEETSLYHQSPQDNDLYCDVGQLATVSSALEVQDNRAGVLGYKAYLFPPSPGQRAVEGLESLIDAVEESKLPLLVDVISPTMRLYHETSPCHFMTLEDRLSTEDISDSQIFAGAFPDEAQDSDVEEETEEPMMPTRTMSNSVSLQGSPEPSSVAPEQASDHSGRTEGHKPARDRLFSIMMKPTSGKHCRSYHNIFSDLDHRIRVSEQSIQNLSKVEQFTYSRSGSTFFNIEDPQTRPKSNSLQPKKKVVSSISLNFLPELLETPPVPTRLDRLGSRRPPQLAIEKKVNRASATEDSSTLYMFYLANFPDQWEVAGVNKVVEAIRSSTCKVHVTCLSSASAINRVRKAQENCNITCEVGASCLFFTDSDIMRGDCRFKNSPPIRSRSNCNLLWDLLKMKGIHSLTSQHRGIHPTYKVGVMGSLKRALSGLNTLGFTLQQVWTKLRLPSSCREELDSYIVRLAKWLSLHPAKVLGIDKQRGSIERGRLADLVIWDPYEQVSIKRTYSQFNETCLLIGADLYGSIHKVMLRGKFVFSNGRFTRYGRRVYKTDSIEC
jgi:dihydroorotase-like cyclic amidohydrolase